VKVETPILLATLLMFKAKTVADLVDFRNHPKAEHPRRQYAFTLFLPNQPNINLKTSEARKLLGIKWYRCIVSEEDINRFGRQESILDAHTDGDIS
jgi:hypothetical protein